MTSTTTMLDLSNPFPGLRCFLSEEDYLFFGRHAQIEDLLRRLRTNRLVAVVGTSGSGKSSLVRAGLLPAVLGGGMAQAGSAWEIAVMRPGGSPMAHLARALCEAGLYDADAEDALFHLQATLSRSRNGLIEAVRQSKAAGSKLLLVVDQFEELFRFNRASATSQELAIGFVDLLLHATQQADLNVYVVLTMRSDFLGECSQFLGLAEAVNDGEFLIPRMTRDQIQEAIEGPIRVRGAEIAPRLLFRLLNDVEDNQDQLPVLQHALMRTWDLWQRSQCNGVAALDLEHYEATGGMHAALSRHADEIFDAFPSDPHRTAAARIFKALTERGPDGRGIRRPTRLGQLVAIAAVEEPSVHRVMEAYRAPGVTFLMPPVSSALEDHSVIDISHESLMRVWSRLRGWVEEEAQSARIYRRLHETCGLHAEKRAGLYHNPDLQIALSWREASGPNSAWAGQYGGGFDEAMAFLDTSREAAEREEKEREAARQRELEQARQLAEAQRVRLEQQQRAAKRLRKLIAGLAVVALIAGLACAVALVARNEASRLAAVAEQEADNARQNEEKAKQNAKRAEQSQQEADQARTAAEKAQVAAQAETYRAMLSEVRALRAGHQPGWREKALGDLARLAVMPTPRRDLPELRTEAAATLGTPDVHLVARVALPSDGLGSFSFSPDGQTLMTADSKTGLDFWDVPGKRHLSFVEGITLPEGIYQFDKAIYLPDGQGLVVATRNRGVVFLDKQGASTTRTPITQNSSQPTKLAISGNGQRIAVAWTGGAGTTVHDAASGALLGRFKDSNPIFALSPDGKWLARQENSDIVLLPIPSGEPRNVLGRHGGARALAFSPDGARLAVAFYDHTTVLWDVAKREQFGTLRGHRERVFDVAFSPDGEWIATGSLDYTTRIWETRTGQNVATLPGFTSPTFGVKWSPTGDFLAASLNNSREVLLYKITGRHRVQQWLTGHGVELGCVAAHPRLERLTTGGYTELNSWDLSVARPSPVAIGPNPGAVTSMAYSPDGSLLAVGSWPQNANPREVVIRDANTGKVRGRISGPQIVRALAFDPTGERLACGDIAGNVVLWDLATSRPVQQFVTGSSVWSIVFLDHPRALVTHSKDAVLLFNLESGKLERKVDLAGGNIRRLVANRERSRLVVGFESGAIGSLSLPDLTPGPRLEHAHDGSVACLALSPDGRLLATASDHRVVLRDAMSFEILLRFPLWDGTLRDLTFDSKGRRLAIVGTGNDVDLWDLDALRDGLTEVGLAWDRPAPAVPAAGEAPEGDPLRPAVPVIRRPGPTDPAAFDEARRLVQSGVGAFEGGRWAEAIRDFQQARDRLRTLHQAVPSDGQVASQLAMSLGYLSSALKNEHRPAEALASLKEARQVLETIRQPSFVDLYNLACMYAKLTTLVEPGSVPPTAAEREALADRAMEALRRSLTAGMTDFALMDRDHDLDPLRGRSDFRGLILESTGHTREAVPHLATLASANPKDTILSLKVAALQAWFGQDKELAATRQRCLSFAKGTNDVFTANQAAKACSILPSTDKAELEAALALGRTAVKIGKGGMWNLLALGMAEYRSGNDMAADEALLAAAQAGPNNPHVTGISAFYRAMSLFRQGKEDEARKLAIAAAAKMKPLPKDENNPLAGNASADDLILWMACKEAKALFKLTREPRLLAVLRSEDKPASNTERLDVAQFADDQKKFAVATRFWAEALESDPKLGDDRQAQHRCNAARAAALAAAGQGKDEPPLDDAAKAKLRRPALDWLKAELTALTKQIESGSLQARPFIVQTLGHWQKDSDLAGSGAGVEEAVGHPGPCRLVFVALGAHQLGERARGLAES